MTWKPSRRERFVIFPLRRIRNWIVSRYCAEKTCPGSGPDWYEHRHVRWFARPWFGKVKRGA